MQQHILEGLDWARVQKIAVCQGVLPLVFKWVKEHAADRIPEREFLAMSGTNSLYRQRSERLSHTLVDLSALFSAKGIEHIAFKGPVLSQQAYGDFAMRQYFDLDLMIGFKDFSSVYDALRQQGFRPEFTLNAEDQKWMLKNEHQFSFFKDQVHLEIHWRLVLKRWLRDEQHDRFLWENRQLMNLAGGTVTTFSPEGAFLAHCIHAAKHGWQPFKNIADMVYLLTNNLDLDHEKIISLAERFQQKRQMIMGFIFLDFFTRLDVSHKIKMMMQSERGLVEKAAKILDSYASEVKSEDQLDHTRDYFDNHQRYRDRIPFLVAAAFSPRYSDYASIRLPRALRFVYPTVRILRLIVRSL